jgi:3,4-dihydroxy 2-butanone 4-phosphate synthase
VEVIKEIQRALSELQKGRFVLVYDDDNREGETDFVIASQFITPDSIRTMRQDGGGLIFLMVSHDIAHRFQLPFLADLYTDIEKKYPVLHALAPNDIPYDTKSSFSLYVNHRETFTGITDNDRSLTIKRFSQIVDRIEKDKTLNPVFELGNEFRSPGHVPICIASKRLLAERKGHTELVVSLLKMADVLPVGSGCEIMGNNGKALSKAETIAYAKKNKFVFLEGKDIIHAWRQWLK